jgi:hypothetical protein
MIQSIASELNCGDNPGQPVIPAGYRPGFQHHS